MCTAAVAATVIGMLSLLPIIIIIIINALIPVRDTDNTAAEQSCRH